MMILTLKKIQIRQNSDKMIIPIEFWIVVAVIAIIFELLSTSFFSLSIGVGAIASAITNYYNYNLTIQVTTFIVVSVVCIILTRPLSNLLNKKSERKSNTERFIGKEARVIQTINSKNPGKIIVDNETWLAISDTEIDKNNEVMIVGIEGVKLIVKKI